MQKEKHTEEEVVRRRGVRRETAEGMPPKVIYIYIYMREVSSHHRPSEVDD